MLLPCKYLTCLYLYSEGMEPALTIRFILVLIWLSGQGQGMNPFNSLIAEYQGNGSIRLTWEPSDTYASLITGYYVSITLISGTVVAQGHVTDTFYVLDSTYQDTSYWCEVVCRSKFCIIGRSNVTVHTDKAEFRKVGTNARLYLPRPQKSLTAIVFNGSTLFTFGRDSELYGPSTQNNIIVRLTNTNTVLDISSLTPELAGYYYTMVRSGNIILGGKLLVVTDTPTKPRIRADPVSPAVDSSVTLTCSSQSTSKPDNHGLKMSSSWKLNGSDVDHDRFINSGINLMIKQVRLTDRYTCRTSENIPPPVQQSAASDDFILNPVYGPLSVTIESGQRLPPLIIGELYTSLVCKTECYPECQLQWIKDRTHILTGKNSNTLTLNMSTAERKKEITLTCEAEHTRTGKRLEKNLTIMVYYPPNIISARFSVDGSQPKDMESLSTREGSNLIVILDIDSNPESKVFIERVDVPGLLGTLIYRQKQYIIIMNSLQCQHTGRYNIMASNIVKQNKSEFQPKTIVFDLAVKCTPRLISGTSHLIEKAGKIGDVIMFNVTVIAFPKPTVKGSASVTEARVGSVNEYTYSVEGQVAIKQESDFKDHNVSITNNIHEIGLIVVIRIRPEDLSTQGMSVSNIALTSIVVILGVTVTILLAILILRCHGNKNGKMSRRLEHTEQRENYGELECLTSRPEAQYASGRPQHKVEKISEVKGSSYYDDDVHTEQRRPVKGDYEDMATVYPRTFVPHKNLDKNKPVIRPISADTDEYIDVKPANAAKPRDLRDAGHHEGKSQYENVNVGDTEKAPESEKLTDILPESRGCGEEEDYETLNSDEVGQAAIYKSLRRKRGKPPPSARK